MAQVLHGEAVPQQGATGYFREKNNWWRSEIHESKLIIKKNKEKRSTFPSKKMSSNKYDWPFAISTVTDFGTNQQCMLKLVCKCQINKMFVYSQSIFPQITNYNGQKHYLMVKKF